MSAGIDPDIVGPGARDAVAFASAAVHHDLADPNGYLEAAGGNPDEAWRQWAMSSLESPLYEGDDEDDGDRYGAGEGDDVCRVHGWATAHIGSVGPGEYTIDLYDDLGLPGDATYVDALTFSLPATAAAGWRGDRDACVIKAATEELAAYGCIPGSDFLGGDGSFRVQVYADDKALEWLEDQRSVAEKLGAVFDTWNSSGPLSGTTARGAVLLSGCAGAVGWVGDDRVLCRTSSGSFRPMDARTGRAAGAPIGVVGPRDGTVAEGLLVSADGKRFIVAVHRPDARQDDYDFGYQAPDFRVVPTTRTGGTTDVTGDVLDTNTVFLSWS
ncbi:hypothetical protein [Streptomyces shenzhenensis]|uniref:hypothetical protein n=1 Tax=Streptomyces shenzhenensis TaxID=943815 RepID=UPI00215D9EDD|nr:hypothetical protein [Streptomyces shenzhenensis]